MEYIETVNPRLNRSEYWRVFVEDLLVVFKRPLDKWQDQTYNAILPGTKHSLVREFDRKRRRVRFWTCQVSEFRGGIHLSFDWDDRPRSGTSSGISFHRRDIVRMVRRGVHVEREPNLRCRDCEREGDWRCGYRISRKDYNPAHDYMEGGKHYRGGDWFCNRCLARELARGRERIDVFRPRDGSATLARLRSSRRVAAAERMERLTLRRWRRVMLDTLASQRAFWKREVRSAQRSRVELQNLCAGRPVPATAQRVLTLLSRWQEKASRERHRLDEERGRWSRVEGYRIGWMMDS